jgi:hypothetical protein
LVTPLGAGRCYFRFCFSVVDGCDLPYFGVTNLPVLDDRQLTLLPEDDPFLAATKFTPFPGS